MSLQRSTAWPIVLVGMALVVYATLYPWSGWQWPSWAQVDGWLPRHRWETTTDLASNLLGYIPLGLFLCLALLRSGWHTLAGALMAVLCCSGLSYALELIQYTLPGRVPSVADWTLNTLGAAWGVLAALVAQALGVVDAWQRWRERWFIPEAGVGLMLLWLWPLGLLFPPPLPLAQGQLWPTLQWLLVDWTANTSWQVWFLPEGDVLDAMIHDRWAQWVSLGKAQDVHPWTQSVREGVVVALGLLAPMTVVGALTRQTNLRLVLMVLMVLMGGAASAVSAAMNYGPEHALVWLTLPTAVGLLAGALLGALLLGARCLLVAVVGMFVLGGLVYLVHRLPPDPYYAETLQAWEHGRFIRFHGLSRWFGLLWPYLAMIWLLGRVLTRAAPKIDP
jgi:VanZ family protein